MLNVPKQIEGTDYKLVNAMVMYRPHWLAPRAVPGDQAEVHAWETIINDCLIAVGQSGKVWPAPAPTSALGTTGPELGALLKCVEARLAAAGRHHKGLLSFYPHQPLPDRYLPSTRDWNRAP